MIRYAALLRGTESAWQALSYGLESVTVFGEVGGVYLNFGLWGIAVLPAWLLLRHFGARKDGSGSGEGGGKVVAVTEVRETNAESGSTPDVQSPVEEFEPDKKGL